MSARASTDAQLEWMRAEIKGMRLAVDLDLGREELRRRCESQGKALDEIRRSLAEERAADPHGE